MQLFTVINLQEGHHKVSQLWGASSPRSIRLIRDKLPSTNTLAYFASLSAMKKMIYDIFCPCEGMVQGQQQMKRGRTPVSASQGLEFESSHYHISWCKLWNIYSPPTWNLQWSYFFYKKQWTMLWNLKNIVIYKVTNEMLCVAPWETFSS